MVHPERIILCEAVLRIQKLLFPNSIPRWPYEPGADLVEHAVTDQIIAVWGVKWLERYSRRINQIPPHARVRPMSSDILQGPPGYDTCAWNHVQVEWFELWAYATNWLNANGYHVDGNEDHRAEGTAPKRARGRPNKVDAIAAEMEQKLEDQLERTSTKRLAQKYPNASETTVGRARRKVLKSRSVKIAKNISE